MKRVLIVYDSRTGRTEKMAKKIAEGVRSLGREVVFRRVADVRSESELEGFDAYLFGSPTYFRRTTEAMQTFLFVARKADLRGKVGGAFGSYTHIGSGPRVIYDTMEQVFGMEMADVNPFNVKEQVLDEGRGDQPCIDYGRAIAERL